MRRIGHAHAMWMSKNRGRRNLRRMLLVVSRGSRASRNLVMVVVGRDGCNTFLGPKHRMLPAISRHGRMLRILKLARSQEESPLEWKIPSG
jgi:hypothetical protein